MTTEGAFLVTTPLTNHTHNTPIRIVGRQDNRGAGVGIAGDPGAVDGKENHEHHEEEDHDGAHVGVGKVTGLVSWIHCGRFGRLRLSLSRGGKTWRINNSNNKI